MRLVELNSTRSNTTAPAPKGCGKSQGPQRREVFLDVYPSVQRTRACSLADGGTVEGQSEPEVGERGATMTSATSLPRILPSQAHNSLIRKLGGR